MKTLRSGDRGAQVAFLQLALQRAGYDAGALDGIFGSRTQAAVIAFQRAARLTPDGIAGARTLQALDPYFTGYRTRTVAQGDTFWRLATQYGITVCALQTANPKKDPEQLHSGDTLIVPLSFPVVSGEIPFTYEVLQYTLRGLTARYPFLRRGQIGASVLGRELAELQFGQGETRVFYNAAHHANEWITTPVLLRFLEELCSAYACGSEIYGISAKRIFDHATVCVVPMVDPDGVDLVTGWFAPDSQEYQGARAIAGNYPAVSFPDGWKANILGTDLNLNYPANWEQARQIKFAQGFTSPAPRDFVGTAPLSAPESRAVEQYSRRQNFDLTLSYHSQGEIIYWKYLDYEPQNSLEIAKLFARVSGYSVEETPYASGFAGYKDWFIQTYNRPGYTIEVGRGSSPLPLSQFDRIYRDNAGILTLAAIVV